jgi:hypothetical protein
MVIPFLFIKESLLDAALGWFSLGVLKLYCRYMHSSLVGSIYLHLSAWDRMSLHAFPRSFILIISWYFSSTLHVEGWTCMVPRICMVFHLIWLGGSF